MQHVAPFRCQSYERMLRELQEPSCSSPYIVSSSEWNSSFWRAVVEGTRGDGHLLLPSPPPCCCQRRTEHARYLAVAANVETCGACGSGPAQWNRIPDDESQQQLLFSTLCFLDHMAN
ncbi:uncharacterized [Tachysurus ichikawai]